MNLKGNFSMIRFIEHYFHYADERGSITGLINDGAWAEINLIQSEGNAVRGNHYHEYTEELFVILEGKIRLKLQRVKGQNFVGDCEEYLVQEGNVFIIEKNTNHVFEIVDASKWINALSIKTDSLNPDIVRVNS